MRRRARLAAVAFLAAAPGVFAQIVPLARCNAALPCSIPFGLRPADATAFSPYAKTGQGNAAISVSAGVEEGLKPRIDQPAISEDPSERAARIFVKRNPIAPTVTPTPQAP
ncbi:MAG: hypothetical protein WEB59_00730 [Thermoanaerobaculia bacterium]